VLSFSGTTTTFTVRASSALNTGDAAGDAADGASAAVQGADQPHAVDPVALAGGRRTAHQGLAPAAACQISSAATSGVWPTGWQLWWGQAMSWSSVLSSQCGGNFGEWDMSLQARWAALSRLYESSVQYKACLRVTSAALCGLVAG